LRMSRRRPAMNPTQTLAELAVTHPPASGVFLAHGLDFCCNGRRGLVLACREKGLDADAVLAEIAAREAAVPASMHWALAPVADLVGHIVGHYHARHRADLPEIITLARTVESVHAEKPTCPHGLREHLEAIHAAVLDHLDKEEGILFPLILSGRGFHAAGPVAVMEREHVEHGANLAITRRLTNDLTPPPEACTTWRALYVRLATLEAELMEHIHLENNVLFQRALAE
jgi:regulator of cell morphogenesis and NO signaling